MISPNDYKIPIADEAYFDNMHTMALVSFFPRSGSTLLGYLLTAHRNMIVASEPAKDNENLYEELPPMMLLNYILYMDKLRFEEGKSAQLSATSREVPPLDNAIKRTYNKQDRYIFIPNQWQACCESLQVIGIKNSLLMAKALLVEGVWENLKKNLRKIGIRHFKFIFTVRNPYDIVTTDVVYWAGNKRLRTVTKDDIYKMLDYKIKVSFLEICEIGSRVFTIMKPYDIFVHKHEDIIDSPAKQLTSLCDFLNVSAHADYLDDCASVIRAKANKSRYELDWSKEQKQEMERLIEKYDFFSGYSWDS